MKVIKACLIWMAHIATNENWCKNKLVKIERNKIMNYFLGDFDYLNNQSTETFISEICKIIEERDSLVKDLANLTPILSK